MTVDYSLSLFNNLNIIYSICLKNIKISNIKQIIGCMKINKVD